MVGRSVGWSVGRWLVGGSWLWPWLFLLLVVVVVVAAVVVVVVVVVAVVVVPPQLSSFVWLPLSMSLLGESSLLS